MITLTKEKREELKRDAQLRSVGLDYYVRKNPGDNAAELYWLLVNIALAALTTEPFAFVSGDALSSDYDSKAIVYPARVATSIMKTGFKFIPLFIAPPVPEIKLPETIPSMGQDSEYGIGHNDGWNECLAEIERLNGLGD